MLLAINCNNTNIKFGVVEGDRIVGEWRQHTSAMRTGDEHAVWLMQLMAMEGIDPKSVTDAIIGSVVPNANFNLRRLCTRYFNCEPMFIGDPDVVPGIKIKVVSTGGLAPVFEGSIGIIEQTVPDITARGLIEIFRRSRKK